jgi:hypothetical protein
MHLVNPSTGPCPSAPARLKCLITRFGHRALHQPSYENEGSQDSPANKERPEDAPQPTAQAALRGAASCHCPRAQLNNGPKRGQGPPARARASACPVHPSQHALLHQRLTWDVLPQLSIQDSAKRHNKANSPGNRPHPNPEGIHWDPEMGPEQLNHAPASRTIARRNWTIGLGSRSASSTCRLSPPIMVCRPPYPPSYDMPRTAPIVPASHWTTAIQGWAVLDRFSATASLRACCQWSSAHRSAW